MVHQSESLCTADANGYEQEVAANQRQLDLPDSLSFLKTGGLDSQGRLVLLQKHEVPIWLAFNPYILKGYRWNLTRTQCLMSIVSIHNETGTTA